ncbi:MAG: carbamoyltransferase HypF [bacterium]
MTIHGAVQGVGFRPFVYRLARELGLVGWVLNSSGGVFIEVEGERPVLEGFLLRLEQEKPARSIIQSLEFSFLEPVGYTDFGIRHSEETGEKTVLILPDIAACPKCRREVGDTNDRRYHYPFTNCTHCGPRFTIIRALPYDRPNTSMAHFPLCPDCRREYEDPLDRRFHAQPVACPVCGPRITLWDGARNHESDEAVREAAQAVREGYILAMKGLGGFLLIVDARNETAVQRLRARKHREEKPFALLYPSLDVVERHCFVSPLEERLLISPESPIVLLRRRPEANVVPSVAPANPYLGVMLPYTPLHDLLMQELDFPVVATSGNRADEPICIDENEAWERLGHIADLFLIHNRPIVRHCDDSVVRVVLNQKLVLRRARGYAPLPVLFEDKGGRTKDERRLTRRLKDKCPPILAVGAHLKNTIALSVEGQVFLSQHIGDLDTPEACVAFERVIADFLRLYEAKPIAVAHDLHPDYFSTQWARKFANSSSIELISIQHHHAHLAACLAENEVEGPVLGITWDGTGYGPDGTVWGGEFLWGDASGFVRAAHLRPFRLPGGEMAVKEPRRTALGMLWEHFGQEATEWKDLPPVVTFSPEERRLLRQMLERGVNCPVTTSGGRLFDTAASLIGLRQQAAFEAQAAMMLEYVVDETVTEAYPLPINNEWVINDRSSIPTGFTQPKELQDRGIKPIILDWGPLLEKLLTDVRQGVSVGVIAARFHNGLVKGMVAVALAVGAKRVALSGGCFQNRLLLERAFHRLSEAGIRVYLHQRIPPNDGGIALGQTAIAKWKVEN